MPTFNPSLSQVFAAKDGSLEPFVVASSLVAFSTELSCRELTFSSTIEKCYVLNTASVYGQ